jgi:hypothetical protein
MAPWADANYPIPFVRIETTITAFQRYPSVIAEIVGERRRKASVVADSFSVVRGVQSSIGYAVRVVTERTKFAEGTDDLLRVVHLDDAVVVLIADKGVTVSQTYGTRGQWACASGQVAGLTGTCEVLPHNVLILINLDNAGVVGISDKRVAILEPAGKSDTTHWIVDVRVPAAVLPDNLFGTRDFDRAVIVLIADKNVTVFQELCAVRIVELVGPVTGEARGAVLPDDFLCCDINLDDSLVRLIGDEHMAVGKPSVLHGHIELIGATASDAKLPILPDNVSVAVDQDHAVVGATAGIGAVRRFGLAPGGSGASH